MSVRGDGRALSSTITLTVEEQIFLLNLLGREAKALDDLERSGFLGKTASKRLRGITDGLRKKIEASIESGEGP